MKKLILTMLTKKKGEKRIQCRKQLQQQELFPRHPRLSHSPSLAGSRLDAIDVLRCVQPRELWRD